MGKEESELTASFLRAPEQAVFRDRLETKVAHWLGRHLSETDQANLAAGMIGIPLSKTSISHSGASMLPGAVRAAFKAYTTYSLDYDVDLADFPAADLGDIAMHITDLSDCHQRIEQTIGAVLHDRPQMVPILVGGDHSITAPVVRAFSKPYHARGGRVGIIHFDAHHDVRNLEDGGPSNGTPFRQLLDGGVVDGRNLVQIGIRGFMNARAYHEYVREQGVTVYSAKDVARNGIDAIVEQALQIAGNGTDAIYVSFDMDVLDQAYAPGCPAIGTGGMNPWDAMDALYRLGAEESVRGIDFVCVDPTQDVRNVTTRVLVQLLLTFMAGMMKRTSHP